MSLSYIIGGCALILFSALTSESHTFTAAETDGALPSPGERVTDFDWNWLAIKSVFS